MKRLSLALALPALLVGCGYGLPRQDQSLQDQLRNPLYAEFYYNDLTDQMINIALRDEPMMSDAAKRNVIDRTRTRALEHARYAEETQTEGAFGVFLSDTDSVVGDALLLDGILYLGPTFDAAPSPSQSLYLSAAVDPREGTFPDPTAVRVGGLKNQYGAQAIDVSKLTPAAGTGAFRTAVLWDDELETLYGFVQLTHIAR
jgi:hypothetical protein